MYTIRQYTHGWIIFKDGKEVYWGFGSTEKAIATAKLEGVILTFRNCELKKVA